MDASGISLAKGSSANQCDFFQMLEQSTINAITGKTVTTSVLFADGTLYYGHAVWATSIVTVVNTDKCAIYIGGGSPGYTNFCFRTKGSYTNKIVAAKLELGDTQTLCHQENGVWVLNEIPNYAEELAKCQRYLYVIKNEYTSGENTVLYNIIGQFLTYNAGAPSVYVSLPVSMSSMTCSL